MTELKEPTDMSNDSLVSVVIIFLNAEKYLQEAIESVLAQTYPHWELLLVDDGSTDSSTEIARNYANRMTGKVRYLDHPGHANHGTSASRNLGIKQAKGEYLGFLDADDVWLPAKLEQQVSVLNARPEVGMLYGNALYWHSWTGNPEDIHRDYVPKLGLSPNTCVDPPQLLPLFLGGKAAVPCPSSILIRRTVVNELGGFEEIFREIIDDQAFYAKVCLKVSVVVSDVCWDKYRQHPESSTAIARRTGQEMLARQFFLDWLGDYLYRNKIKDEEVWRALQRELWRIQNPVWLPQNARLQYLARWLKKWLLRGEERLLPDLFRHRLWTPKHRSGQSVGG